MISLSIANHERYFALLIAPGPGTTTLSLSHALHTLRRLLSPNYSVSPLPPSLLLTEPWSPTCALLVFPGGADLPYCESLNGPGNALIKQYISSGGKYLGLCAGGYYGSARCEFEIGRQGMEVVGDRQLAFFPGTARGCAFSGFIYDSEAGTRPAKLRVRREGFTGGKIPTEFRSYYNGGCVFVSADSRSMKERGVEVLASFTEAVEVDSGEGEPAAVVYCKVGEGAAVLTSTHPESVCPTWVSS